MPEVQHRQQVKTDAEAWQRYPHHRIWFNKLELALRLGYVAGPAGLAVPKSGRYIIRPVYNLSGMGAGAREVTLAKGDFSTVKPGEFWCEFFDGPNITIDYEWLDDEPVAVFAAKGERWPASELYRFDKWISIPPPPIELPAVVHLLEDVPRFNVELVGDKIVEIHLRPGVDFPEGSSEIIPVWADQTHPSPEGFQWIDDEDDADGHLGNKRLGFYYR